MFDEINALGDDFDMFIQPLQNFDNLLNECFEFDNDFVDDGAGPSQFPTPQGVNVRERIDVETVCEDDLSTDLLQFLNL